MERNEILKQVNDIFIDTLDNYQIIITETTTVFDIEEWDSLKHIYLVVSLEKHFKIRFTTIETRDWNNVGEMIDSITRKISI
jgi:acyl carrier protein